MNKTRPVYWELKSSDHDKFWAASVVEREEYIKQSKGMDRFVIKYILVRKWGKIGTRPQSIEQVFNDTYEAEKVLNRLIREKEIKGYKPIF